MNRLKTLFICSALALTPPSLQARPLGIDDFDRFSDLTDPQVSPDGAWVAYVAGTVDRAADEQLSTIWMVSWDGKEQVPLTGKFRQAHTPRWSPDGRYLAFLGSTDDASDPQIMLLERSSGQVRTLTEATGDIDGYAWAPDGKRLVFVMVSGAYAAPKDGEPPHPIVIDAAYFKEDVLGYIVQGQRQHLYLATVATGKTEALTDDPQFNDTLPVWSTDGSRIAFIRSREHSGDTDGMGDIDLIDAAVGARASTLTRIYTPNVQHMAFSPDGALLAFTQGLEPKYNSYQQDRLAVIPTAGGAVRNVSDVLDRAVTSYAFESANSILVTVEDDMVKYPARLNLKSGAFTRLYALPSVIDDISTAVGHTAVLYTDDHSTNEVYALESKGLRKLTRHNDALMAGINLGAVEEMKFKSRDGSEVHGLMVKPPGFKAGTRYPTLVWIHGGPDFEDEHNFTYDLWQFKRQVLAAKGYVVLAINYRGGSGRGIAFAKEIMSDWGRLETEDLLAGVDYAIERGIADPDRLAIGGRSYGGILTDYMIAHSDRFRAAMSIAGEGNPLATYGTDEYFLQYTYEFGPPWANADQWIKLAYPLLHADKIHTPTLFIGQTKDFNVPLAGGEQMYQALKTLGVPTELVLYPGEFHDLTRPSFMRDEMQRVSDWFERYMNTAH